VHTNPSVSYVMTSLIESLYQKRKDRFPPINAGDLLLDPRGVNVDSTISYLFVSHFCLSPLFVAEYVAYLRINSVSSGVQALAYQ
jgi:hypothetical protein